MIAARTRFTKKNCGARGPAAGAIQLAGMKCFRARARLQRSVAGTLRDCAEQIEYVAEMGFDVLYLPPIHPIGLTERKGKNNSTTPGPDDPGSPWAIGSKEGGHKAIHPELGTLADLQVLREKAERHGIELALDIAFQCSPDHPYVKEHREWFRSRADGSVQYAENPPKKYQDIYPLDFETDALSGAGGRIEKCGAVLDRAGIRIFRVDNPHTKPFAFWEWMIRRGERRFSRGDFPGGSVYAAEGHVPAGETGVHAVVHVFCVEKYQGGIDGILHGNHRAAGERFFPAQSVAQYSGHSE